MSIKKWFAEKNFSKNELYAISTADEPVVKRETEKAVLIAWTTDFGKIEKWIPKSCIENL